MPRRGVGRSRLTEGEASELDEHHFDGHITFTRLVEQRGGASHRKRGAEHVRVHGIVALGRELEVSLTEGTAHAVFRVVVFSGRRRHTRTGCEVVTETIVLAEIARPRRLVIDRTIE